MRLPQPLPFLSEMKVSVAQGGSFTYRNGLCQELREDGEGLAF
jgi:hypothetical protein